jgi:hypothetical protein
MTTAWLGVVVEPELEPAPQPVSKSPLQMKMATEEQDKRMKNVGVTGNGVSFLIFCPQLWKCGEAIICRAAAIIRAR